MIAPHVPGLSDLRPLGHGGFATVYRARQSRLDREVAVKIGNRLLHDERDGRRFLREAHAAGNLSNHPHVVTVHDSGITPTGQPYPVMELCTGSLADELSKTGALQPERVREIGVQLADAVATAQEKGILHRDIKPANVLVDAFGTVELGDFGLAAILDATNESRSWQQVTTYEDLTPYEAHPHARHGELNVGWLGAESVFERGAASQEFEDALTKLVVNQQVHLTRGFRRCGLCGASRPRVEHGSKSLILGNSEIRVTGENGTVYAAPSMIAHYVEEHEYVPPAEFIEAVLHTARR